MNSIAVWYRLIQRLVHKGYVEKRKDSAIRQFLESKDAGLVEKRVKRKSPSQTNSIPKIKS